MKRGKLNFKALVKQRVDEQWSGKVASAERDAGLNKDTIRNVMRREDGSGTTLATAMDIAEGLGLEFYIGPPRDEQTPSVLGFAESRAGLDQFEEVQKDQLFLPMPYSRHAAERGVGSLAFRQDWFDQLGLPPDNLRLVTITGDGLPPTIPVNSIALIDEAQRKADVANIVAVKHEQVVSAFTVTEVDADHFALVSAISGKPPVICRIGSRSATHKILGRIVWWGHSIKDAGT